MFEIKKYFPDIMHIATIAQAEVVLRFVVPASTPFDIAVGVDGLSLYVGYVALKNYQRYSDLKDALFATTTPYFFQDGMLCLPRPKMFMRFPNTPYSGEAQILRLLKHAQMSSLIGIHAETLEEFEGSYDVVSVNGNDKGWMVLRKSEPTPETASGLPYPRYTFDELAERTWNLMFKD